MGILPLSLATVLMLITLLGSAYTIFDLCTNITSYTPIFDVPLCKGVSSCSKMAYPYEGGYSYYVGKAWYLVNNLRERYELLISFCSQSQEEEEALDKISQKGKTLYSIARETIYYTSKANQYALVELSNLEKELRYAGIEKSTHPAWTTFYSRLTSFNKEDIYRKIEELKSIDTTIFSSTTVYVYVASKLLSIPFNLLNIPREFLEGKSYDPYAIEKMVNLSIGNSNSILSHLRELRAKYEDILKSTDKEVEEMKKTVEKDFSFLRETLNRLRFEDPTILTSYIPSRTVVSEVISDIEIYPSLVLSRASHAYSTFMKYYNLYKQRNRYLEALEYVRESYNELKNLRNDAELYLNTLTSAADSCIKSLRSYNYSVSTHKFEAYVISSAARDLLSKLRACKELSELVERDKKVSDTEGAFQRCKDEFEKRWGITLLCEGTPSERLLCCERETARMYNNFISSEEYLRYTKLYNTLEEIFISSNDDTHLFELYRLPRNPENREELLKSYPKLLSLYDDAEKSLSYLVEIRWEGYLSSQDLSEVVLIIRNPSEVSVEGKVTIPFEFVGYDVEGDMIVRIEGKKLYYRGKGESTIIFHAKPVDLEEEVISFDNGYILLSLYNPYSLPVESYTPYTPVSLSEGATYEENHLILQPGSTAVLRFKAVEMDTEVTDDYVSFLLTNISPYRYEGTVELPVIAQSAPSYCASSEDSVICKVRLDPGESTILKIKGTLIEKVEDPPSPLEKPHPQLPNVSLSTSLPKPSQSNELLEKLRSYIRRARELNAEHILPFDESFLTRIEPLYEKYPEEVGYILSMLDEKIRNEAEVRVSLLKKLAEETGDKDLANMALLAEKSLLTGDYILPLVLTSSLPRYLDVERAEFPFHIFLGVLSLLLVIYLLKPPKKRRIPKY